MPKKNNAGRPIGTFKHQVPIQVYKKIRSEILAELRARQKKEQPNPKRKIEIRLNLETYEKLKTLLEEDQTYSSYFENMINKHWEVFE